MIWKFECQSSISTTPCVSWNESIIVFPALQSIYFLDVKFGNLIDKINISDTVNLISPSSSLISDNEELFIFSDNKGKMYAYIIKINNEMRICIEDKSSCLNIKFPKEVFSSPILWKQYIFQGCRDDNFYIMEILQQKFYLLQFKLHFIRFSCLSFACCNLLNTKF